MSGIGDGSGLDAPLVVFLVIIAAAAAVTCGYAVHRLFFINRDTADHVFDKPSTEQEAYMRQVRLRNQGGNWNEAREAAASRQT